MSTRRALGRPVSFLRAMHSGHIGDYVAWLALGIVVMGGALAAAVR
jgi:multicomponent Na+:H+ antiporter subunit D